MPGSGAQQPGWRSCQPPAGVSGALAAAHAGTMDMILAATALHNTFKFPLPCRQLVALAQSLADVAPALQLAVRSGGSPWLGLQVMAGCKALTGAHMLINDLLALRLSSQTAFKMAAACGLVFGPGAALVEAPSAPGQLAASSSNVGHATELLYSQLAAVAGTVTTVLGPEQQRRAAAAFAASTGKPAALVPWLVGLCRALLAAADVSPSECARLHLMPVRT